ncbi:MAG: hypothetical protein KKH28_11845 [Elusimicrobia bacterium]|nr:hypothetical protein [Elusimicrobiota bacterium]
MKSDPKTNHKKVIVLGTGASEPAGVPLISEFLQAGMQEAFAGKWEELKPLNEYWRKKYSLDLYPPPTIEDGIPYHSAPNSSSLKTDIEKVLEDTEALAEQGELDRSVPEGIKQFIFRVISSRANIGKRDAIVYDKLVQRDIVPYKGQLTIISFNYDTILEKFLLVPNDLASQFSYRLPHPFIEGFNSYEQDYTGTFDYLKLHGSLNWLRCPRCGKFFVRWAGTYLNASIRGNCCGELREMVLIPPQKGKAVYMGALRPIWELAENSLSQADEVIVIGYSFRPSDVEACNLFAKSLCSDMRKNFSLTIVDKNTQNIIKRLSELGISGQVIKQAQRVGSFKEYTEPLISSGGEIAMVNRRDGRRGLFAGIRNPT